MAVDVSCKVAGVARQCIMQSFLVNKQMGTWLQEQNYAQTRIYVLLDLLPLRNCLAACTLLSFLSFGSCNETHVASTCINI